jgi:hypothetical protein
MGVLGGNGQAHAVASMDLVLLRRSFFVGMSICIQLGRWWVFMQYHCGKMKLFTFSITWISSSRLTSTHERERRKQTTLLREHRGGLLPCRRNVVCVFPLRRATDGHVWRHVVAKNIKNIKNTYALSDFSEYVKWFIVKGLCIFCDLLKAPLSLELRTHGLRAKTYYVQVLRTTCAECRCGQSNTTAHLAKINQENRREIDTYLLHIF